VGEEDGPWPEAAFDDISGAELGTKKVYKARIAEVPSIRGMNMYDKAILPSVGPIHRRSA